MLKTGERAWILKYCITGEEQKMFRPQIYYYWGVALPLHPLFLRPWFFAMFKSTIFLVTGNFEFTERGNFSNLILIAFRSQHSRGVHMLKYFLKGATSSAGFSLRA